MRAFDVVGIGCALILVPMLAWIVGRYAGRRDWRIGTLLITVILLALMVQVDILGVLAYFETSATLDFPSRAGRRVLEAAQSPEFSAFLLVLSSFIGMLGWSSTPARKTEAA